MIKHYNFVCYFTYLMLTVWRDRWERYISQLTVLQDVFSTLCTIMFYCHSGRRYFTRRCKQSAVESLRARSLPPFQLSLLSHSTASVTFLTTSKYCRRFPARLAYSWSSEPLHQMLLCCFWPEPILSPTIVGYFWTVEKFRVTS